MRIYELILVLRASLSETEKKKVLDNIKKLLKDLKITKEDEWGKKELAFKIKKEKEGNYLALSFEGESLPANFGGKILAEENILRHLLIRIK